MRGSRWVEGVPCHDGIGKRMKITLTRLGDWNWVLDGSLLPGLMQCVHQVAVCLLVDPGDRLPSHPEVDVCRGLLQVYEGGWQEGGSGSRAA